MSSPAQNPEAPDAGPPPEVRRRELWGSLVFMSLFEVLMALPLLATIKQVFSGDAYFPVGLPLGARAVTILFLVFNFVVVVILVPLQLHRYLRELRSLP